MTRTHGSFTLSTEPMGRVVSSCRVSRAPDPALPAGSDLSHFSAASYLPTARGGGIIGPRDLTSVFMLGSSEDLRDSMSFTWSAAEE
jgi:hypothetical protein